MENKGKAGVNIRLRAKTGSDGKLNVSWDPLNNASKQRNEELGIDTKPSSGKKIKWRLPLSGDKEKYHKESHHTQYKAIHQGLVSIHQQVVFAFQN